MIGLTQELFDTNDEGRMEGGTDRDAIASKNRAILGRADFKTVLGC